MSVPPAIAQARPASGALLGVATPIPSGSQDLARLQLTDGGFGAGLRLLAGADAVEPWYAPARGYRIEQLCIDGADADIAAAAERGYRELLRRVRGSSEPFLLRIWNYFAGINQGEGDAERYRAFCVGRAAAVDADFHRPPPAATAIGSVDPEHADRLTIVALCAAEPGIALENPRQTPAWRYPREYGPVAPGFSRGVVIGRAQQAVLLASGTASIAGHVSLHPGDLSAQLGESVANLQALLAEGSARSGSRFSFAGCQALRVYLRDPATLAQAQAVMRSLWPNVAGLRFLQGEVCRRELEVELEGVFAAD